ncbi:YdiY family protein [Glaciecola sp. SC05]|uniref:DUF481 domain-containing protein n=1 Tax=Glaciecola sp. SC05 TaxID=1987355 RepID=UPI003526D39F
MKILLSILLLIFTVSSFAEMSLELEPKASDFFKSPSAKRNLIRLLNTHPTFEEEEAEELPTFELDGEVGVLITTGNTNTTMVKLALDAEHELESWSNTYFMQALQRNTEIDKQKNENSRLQLSAQFDYKLLNPDYRFFTYTEFDDNEFLQLRNQFTSVIGWSHLAWKEEHTEFRYSFGPGWARSEQQDTGLLIEEMIVRATANYAYRFENDARFRQSISAEMGKVNRRARSQTSVSAKIIERLAMKVSFEVNLDENVSRNVDNFTTQTSISMVYQFF